MLDCWRRLDKSELRCTIHAARPGEPIELGRDRFAVPFRSIHRVPTLGYSLWSRRRRLRAELRGLSQAAIRERRLGGETVTTEVSTCELAFTGETNMNITVDLHSGDLSDGRLEKTAECLVVLIAVDAKGNPLPVDRWTPETPGEIALASSARAQFDSTRPAPLE